MTAALLLPPTRRAGVRNTWGGPARFSRVVKPICIYGYNPPDTAAT